MQPGLRPRVLALRRGDKFGRALQYKMPGAAMGTCTVFCNPDPDDCPDGHRCFDLSTLGVAGYEPFCIKG